jgi:CRP/FNR family transcriptional regulator, cyclic AMP receptor protein
MPKDKSRKSLFDPKMLTGQQPGQTRKRFASGQVIYAQGDLADALFYVESGWIKVSTVAASGREAVVGLCGTGEIIGLSSLIGTVRWTTAASLTSSTVVRVTRSALSRLLRDEPGFAEAFTVHVVRQGGRDRESLIDLLTHTAEQRLASALLRLANRGRGGDNAIPTKISQALFAKLIGTTRSRVSFFLNRFKRQGFIEYERDGRIRVRSSLRRAITREAF